MRKILTMILALAMSLSLGSFAMAQEPAQNADFGIFPAVSGEDGTTYVNLFEVILD